MEKKSNQTSSNSFDPNSFSKDELLRFVYRDIQVLIAKTDERHREYAMEKDRIDGKIKTNELDIRELKTVISEQNKSFKNLLAIITIFLGILSVMSGIIGWVLQM